MLMSARESCSRGVDVEEKTCAEAICARDLDGEAGM